MAKVFPLDCGCIVKDNIVVSLCGFHYENQPHIKDPLDKYLIENDAKFNDDTKGLNEFVKIEFLNDGKKDLIIRTTPASSLSNPKVIKAREIGMLYVKPKKGFMKLWPELNHFLVI